MSTVLSVTKRETGHRSTITQLRKGGAIPAVIYGYKVDSTPISIAAKDFKNPFKKWAKQCVFARVRGEKSECCCVRDTAMFIER